jgi:hypothetical protein
MIIPGTRCDSEESSLPELRGKQCVHQTRVLRLLKMKIYSVFGSGCRSVSSDPYLWQTDPDADPYTRIRTSLTNGSGCKSVSSDPYLSDKRIRMQIRILGSVPLWQTDPDANPYPRIRRYLSDKRIRMQIRILGSVRYLSDKRIWMQIRILGSVPLWQTDPEDPYQNVQWLLGCKKNQFFHISE